MKIIKLTESDLKHIVKKVLIEQRAIPTASRGQKGEDATKIQQALKLKGYDLGNFGPNRDGVDGNFGPATQRAIKDFQTKMGIKPTGSVDQLTRNYLFAGFANSQFLNSLPGSSQRPGSSKSTGTKPQTTTSKTSGTKPQTTTSKTSGTTGKPNLKDLLKTVDDKPTSDYLGKGGQFERQLYGGSKEDYMKMRGTLAKIPPAKKSSLSLHLRALIDYLNGRETPFTEADLTSDEQKFLKTVAIPNAKKGLTYPLWKEIGAGNLPTSMTVTGSQKEKEKLSNKGGQGSLLKPELAGQFMYTLGEISPPNIKVGPNKDTVTVYDRYDFNTQGKTKEDLMKSFSDQLKSYWNGDSTFYSVVRNAVAFKEAGGYKGYPVKITV
jgi:hypothetical protein